MKKESIPLFILKLKTVFSFIPLTHFLKHPFFNTTIMKKAFPLFSAEKIITQSQRCVDNDVCACVQIIITTQNGLNNTAQSGGDEGGLVQIFSLCSHHISGRCVGLF